MPDTVVAIVLNEAAGSIVQVEGVGESRAIWLEVETAEGVLLVLGAYPRHKGSPEGERLAFWRDRVKECHKLAAQPRYSNCKKIVLGDLNLHLAFLGRANERYEGAVERQIYEMINGRMGLDVEIRNTPGVATHESGTIID